MTKITIKRPDYTLLDHTADLGIRISGIDLKDLFENAGRALMHLMISFEPPEKTSSVKISLSGEDLEDLMVRWLGELLYLFEGENLVVTSVYIDSISQHGLRATLKTIPFDPLTQQTFSEIKAVTYHQIQVADKGTFWEAKVIFDV